jgi:nicotinamidase-related amidase
MPVVGKGPEVDKSALIIVDMQNDFLHRDGNFSHVAREHPEANIDRQHHTCAMLSQSLNHIGRDLGSQIKRTIRIASENILPPKGVHP